MVKKEAVSVKKEKKNRVRGDRTGEWAAAQKKRREKAEAEGSLREGCFLEAVRDELVFSVRDGLAGWGAASTNLPDMGVDDRELILMEFAWRAGWAQGYEKGLD